MQGGAADEPELAFCVFEVEGALCVGPWRDVAIGNVVPARETLPPDIVEHDRRNWFARILREMEGLKPLRRYATPSLRLRRSHISGGSRSDQLEPNATGRNGPDGITAEPL